MSTESPFARRSTMHPVWTRRRQRRTKPPNGHYGFMSQAIALPPDPSFPALSPDVLKATAKAAKLRYVSDRSRVLPAGSVEAMTSCVTFFVPTPVPISMFPPTTAGSPFFVALRLEWLS